MFRSYSSRLAFMPENGMKVIAHGRVTVFVRDGQYQLYVDSMEPEGIGSLYIAFEQLKRKLEQRAFRTRKKASVAKNSNARRNYNIANRRRHSRHD